MRNFLVSDHIQCFDGGKMKGRFYVFEGIDGSGKSTVAEAVYNVLKDKKIPVVLTQEPYQTSEFGRDIRNIFHKYQVGLDVKTELFLFEAARVQHIHDVILPALEQGKIVLCDRFADSSYAYQGKTSKLAEKILRMNRLAVEDVMPDKTFIFKVNIETAMGRSKKAEAKDFLPKKEYERIQAAYLKLVAEYPGYTIVDADKDLESVKIDVLSKII